MVWIAARIFIAVWLMAGAAQVAWAEKRVALIIGNGAYTSVPALSNPRNDAEDMAAALRKLGFTVILGLDLDKRGMDSKILEFERALHGADAGVFHYSGHGLQVAGVNYLVPVDASLESGAALRVEAVRLDFVQETMEREAKTNILFLDACRNNPLARNLARALGTRSVDIGQGLAPAEAGLGTLISFSTQPGNVALDGNGRNSPYSGPLAKALLTSGKDLSSILIAVRNEVLAATGEKQVPWEHSALRAPFYFRTDWTPAPDQEPPLTDGACDGLVLSVAMAGEKPCVKPGSGKSFRDCPNCPEMVIAPSGSFFMGSPSDEPKRYEDESPQHRVTIAKPFAVGKFAVTFAEWDACVAAGGCGGYQPKDEGWGRGDRPVINVSWDDAKAYISWLSKKTGKTYRLLSEAEREYVARAGTTTLFWWGSSIRADQANYHASADPYERDENRREQQRKTLQVKSFEPNPWGLYQVHGNVWEWIEDCWHDSYAGAPVNGFAWTSGAYKSRVLRGGSWGSHPRNIRAANRNRDTPVARSNYYGFRLARELNP